MRLLLQDNLLFTSATLTYQTKRLTLDRVIIDTGSAGTIFSADKVAALGIAASDEDRVGRVFGVGGYETFYMKAIDRLDVGELAAIDFDIEVGEMAYARDIDGILGLDFLLRVGVLIDLKNLELRTA